jgi:hypothetical protein
MDAEHPGQQRGGQFSGEREQGCGAGLAAADAEVAQPFGEAEGADGLAGSAAWEQPRGRGVAADGGVAVPVGQKVACETGEGFGKQDWFGAEADVYLVGGLEVVGGQAADVGSALGVEQDQQSGNSVLGLDGVVVQQPAGLFPPGFGVDDAGWSTPNGSRRSPAGSASVGGPSVRSCRHQRGVWTERCPTNRPGRGWPACRRAGHAAGG